MSFTDRIYYNSLNLKNIAVQNFNNYAHKIVNFVLQQDEKVIIGFIAFLAFFYLYYRLSSLYNYGEFWKGQSEYFLKIAMEANKYNRNIMKENSKSHRAIRSMEIILAKKEEEISNLKKVLHENRGVFINDTDRENIAEKFAYIIRSLAPKNNSDIVKELVDLARNLEIEITVETEGKMKNRKRISNENSPHPLRKQPRRAVAPINFVFSEDEEDTTDDKKSDPDYSA